MNPEIVIMPPPAGCPITDGKIGDIIAWNGSGYLAIILLLGGEWLLLRDGRTM